MFSRRINLHVFARLAVVCSKLYHKKNKGKGVFTVLTENGQFAVLSQKGGNEIKVLKG
jgi:hypothetical protein